VEGILLDWIGGRLLDWLPRWIVGLTEAAPVVRVWFQVENHSGLDVVLCGGS
jgi:hypothetical protein